ncbi:FG-GAP repeat domain-containing protein [Streptomyces sp. NPDC059909]|uniref:FG-GAP repeat domain-containing protein n=1 Tax=Streptomyces sp. NPDC059909 TaxID=3346998 RepID=UPI00365FA62A
MLLAGPASADGPVPPPHRNVVERVTPDVEAPELTLPERTAQRNGYAAGDAEAVPLKSRFDVTGDGYTDLLYRAINGQVYLSPYGSAEDTQFGLYDTPGEMFKDIVPIGDLNADGHPEILALTAHGVLSTHQAFDATGAGAPVWRGKGWQAYNKLTVPGDVNGDGRMDLLARTPGGELYLYTTNGSLVEPFAPRVKVGAGWGAYDQLVGANDADGDGVGDLFARTPSGELYFYAGTGNAAAPFAARVKVGSGWQIYNQLLSVDDINGDGMADLLARAHNGTLYFYSSTGGGLLAARSEAGTGWHVVSLFATSGGNPEVGKGEVFGLDTQGTLFYYWAMNNGLLSPRDQASEVGDWKGAKITFASSLDIDGRGDLLEVFEGTLYNYQVAGSDGGPFAISSGWGQYNTLLAPGDLSGDGKGDLLARNSSGQLYLYRGNGEGTAFSTRVSVGSGWGAYNRIVGAGDITGDGRADIVARDAGGNLYLYAGTGSVTAPFKGRVKIGPGWNAYNKLQAPGDITGDGRADLLATDSTGNLWRYSANGTGGFSARVKIGPGWNTYTSLH